MAWNYRKRIKIFPGVHLNFSKNGVSTSIGPKGAKVSFGKKGTYLNTSIPGTGLYSRRKISGNSKTNNRENMANQINQTPQKNESFFKIKNTWGCCFRWLGLFSIIFLVVNLLQLIFGEFDNSEENQNALIVYGVIAILFIIIYFNRFTSLLKEKINSKNKSKSISEDVQKIISDKTKEAGAASLLEILNKLKEQSEKEAASNLPSFSGDGINNAFTDSTKKKTEQIHNTKSKSKPLLELKSLIGLSDVKKEVSALTDFVKIQQEREKKGLKSVGLSYHCVFTGNPGTGKTTVARILADIYRDLGVLKKGHLVETDRSGLVAEYVGQTAIKTNKIIDSALDGVLFIDEAYSLAQGGNNDFGHEAISTLLKRMEDDRHRLVVVLAGYHGKINEFIDSNPGLQSRFNRYIHFSDYTADELKQIFLLNVKNNQYQIDEKALNLLGQILDSAIEHKDKSFGNGRYVRNLFEKTIQNQAIRLSNQPNVTTEDLSLLKAEDLPPINC